MIRIVIIDDESITRQWVKKKIEDLGADYKIVGVFSNGRQALEFCKSENVDVIFTDIRMSTMDGMEFLSNLQKLDQNPYKVILSAYDDFEYAREAIKLGVHEFLLKPEITQEELKRILRDAQKYLTENSSASTGNQEDDRENQEALRSIMDNISRMAEEEIENKFRNNHIELQKKNLVVMCIQWSDRKGLDKAQDIFEIFFEEKHIKWYYFQETPQEITILYNQPEEWTRLQLAEELYHIVKINAGVNLYIGVSTKIDCLTKIGSIWRQAVIAKENRCFYEQAGAILYDKMTVNKNDCSGELYFNEEHKEVSDLLYVGKYDAAKEKAVDLLLKMSQANFLPPTYVKAICNEVLTAFMHKAQEKGLDEEQEKKVRQIQLLLGENINTYNVLMEKMQKAEDYLCDLLEQNRMRGKYSDAINSVLDYINEHYQEHIVMEEVAEEVHLSRTYLSILFKKETGEKFSDYLQKVRLDKACRLLQDTNQQISEIAENTGFFDTAHFSRVFKEHYAISPAEYRKRR